MKEIKIKFNSVKKQVNEDNELTGYLADGMSIPLAEGNRHYNTVLQWIAEGNTPEPQYTQEELEAKTLSDAMSYFTNEIQAHIDDAIAIFNETNGVAFESLANIDSASNRDGYSLQVECKAFADWAYIIVWDTMRAWQRSLTTIPTEEELKSKLATVAYRV